VRIEQKELAVAATCRKCFKQLSMCSTCKGKGEFSGLFVGGKCSVCKGTGYICPDTRHGPYWQ
jgi:DnaJ-class molecular chaperone